jgi:hypothetical protein
MSQLMDYHTVLPPIQLVSERIFELRALIAKYEAILKNTTSDGSKKVYERKKEWIQGLLEINERLYEQLKEDSSNGLH